MKHLGSPSHFCHPAGLCWGLGSLPPPSQCGQAQLRVGVVPGGPCPRASCSTGLKALVFHLLCFHKWLPSWGRCHSARTFNLRICSLRVKVTHLGTVLRRCKPFQTGGQLVGFPFGIAPGCFSWQDSSVPILSRRAAPSLEMASLAVMKLAAAVGTSLQGWGLSSLAQ